MSVLHLYVWCSERALEPLELELQMVVSHHVGAGDQILVFCKKSLLLETES